MNGKKGKIVFVDRDGTIIEDRHYIKDPNEVIFIPGALTALKLLQDSGFSLVVVSNQSGIARGYFTLKDLQLVHKKFVQDIKHCGVYVDVFYCFHHPQGVIKEYTCDCNCRKPKPGMILKYAHSHPVNFKESFMIGDKEEDIQLGKKLGMISILVRTGKGQETEHSINCTPNYIANDLLSASKWILLRNKMKIED